MFDQEFNFDNQFLSSEMFNAPNVAEIASHFSGTAQNTAAIDVIVNYEGLKDRDFIPNLKVRTDEKGGVFLKSIIDFLYEEKFKVADSKLFYFMNSCSMYYYCGTTDQVDDNLVVPEADF
mmetsp:Transcript_27394/g.24153  ORF Transcript_27394/g.24153 Transcript_27394/m.24153 type:complete len:120 (+) Transcript_27394:77-436(+)